MFRPTKHRPPNWTFWIFNGFPVNQMRQPHEIDFNCISINLILSPWKCYVSDYDWLCWDCDESDTHTHWFHYEQFNYMLSVAFQSKVLIFASFDTFLSMRLHWIISFMVFFFCISLLVIFNSKIVLRMTFITRADHSFCALWHQLAWSGQHERIPVHYEFSAHLQMSYFRVQQ